MAIYTCWVLNAVAVSHDLSLHDFNLVLGTFNVQRFQTKAEIVLINDNVTKKHRNIVIAHLCDTNSLNNANFKFEAILEF